MTRRLVQENTRVVIEPSPDWGWSRRGRLDNAVYLAAEAARIKAEVMRHIDDYAHVYVLADIVTACGYTEHSDDGDGNRLHLWPECCTRDQADFFTEHKAESDYWFLTSGLTNPEYLQEFRQGWHQNKVATA
jgi:hypothetical protein